eukprot:415941_1
MLVALSFWCSVYTYPLHIISIYPIIISSKLSFNLRINLNPHGKTMHMKLVTSILHSFLFLTDHIHNTTVQCSPDTFKYIQVLLKELTHYNGTKHTTKSMDDYIQNNTKRHAIGTPYDEYLRLKSVNGTLYINTKLNSITHNIKYMWRIHKYALNYYNRLFTKYGTQIPNTDFVLFLGNGAHSVFDHKTFPLFISDGSTEYDYVPLFGVPRSSLRLKQSLEFGYNYQDVVSHRNNISFAHKLNQLFFRGSITGMNEYDPSNTNWKITKRGQVIMALNNDQTLLRFMDVKIADKYNFSCKKINITKSNEVAKYCANWVDLRQQMKYKYILVVDGNSVRDVFPINLGFESVVLKQRSFLKEFWYYNLIDGYHYVQWDNVTDLQNKLYAMVENANDLELWSQIALNGRSFVDQYLTDDKMDCFMIHMLQIYNRFLFDSEKVRILSDDDMRVDDLMR